MSVSRAKGLRRDGRQQARRSSFGLAFFFFFLCSAMLLYILMVEENYRPVTLHRNVLTSNLNVVKKPIIEA